MMNTVQIEYLADHTEVITTLAEWFRSEWTEYYVTRTLADIVVDFYEEVNRDYIPIRLVAFLGGELVGTIVLREKILEAHPEYHPGLGGLLVAKPHRRSGIGTLLVQAGTSMAYNIGFPVIFAATNVAGGILERLQWEKLGSFPNHGEQTALYRYTSNQRP